MLAQTQHGTPTATSLSATAGSLDADFNAGPLVVAGLMHIGRARPTVERPQRLGRQPVGPLVEGMPGVPLEPVPGHVVRLGQPVEHAPQVLVLDRLPVAGAPATAHPAVYPLGDTLAQVLGVGVEIHLAAAEQPFQQCQGRCRGVKFHAVVGSGRVIAAEHPFPVTPADDRAPAAGARVGVTAAVGVDVYLGWSAVAQCVWTE